MPNPMPILQIALTAKFDSLMGEFTGSCTTADGCRAQPLLSVISRTVTPAV
jgi:hypothetical protein